MDAPDHELYPLELSLNRVKRSWGGWTGKIGEVWSLSGPPHESLVLNGALAGQRLTEIVGEFQQILLGKDMELDPREPFPLLLKFISTARNLSIQVHPDDAYTIENGLPMVGRDKIFYILNVKPGGLIYLGFKEGFKDKVDDKKIREAAAGGSLHHLMNPMDVKSGQLYTVPAGRIHSIGKGVTLFEIQRHSDLTFNLYDWDSKDVNREAGMPQLDEALKVLDFNPISPRPITNIAVTSGKNRIQYLALTPHFIIRRLIIKEPLELSLKGNCFMVYTGLKGTGWLRWGFSNIYSLVQPYQSILVPAIREDLYFESEEGLEFLETSIPDLAGETMEQLIRYQISPDMITGLGGEDYKGILKEYTS